MQMRRIKLISGQMTPRVSARIFNTRFLNQSVIDEFWEFKNVSEENLLKVFFKYRSWMVEKNDKIALMRS